ncbi:hypothetical protein, partial [Burkholderia humptydooensis]|uniref:hypothetical protein n=1 Tax=Burkholderia humptydooensis TaxID=430531 RepID=UPI000A5886CC
MPVAACSSASDTGAPAASLAAFRSTYVIGMDIDLAPSGGNAPLPACPAATPSVDGRHPQ